MQIGNFSVELIRLTNKRMWFAHTHTVDRCGNWHKYNYHILLLIEIWRLFLRAEMKINPQRRNPPEFQQ